MLSGDVVDGRFEIERLAGTGGMGEVFRALDRTTGDPVALKFLHIKSDQDVERFEREASILSGLDDPGIVRYLAHGRTPTGDHYLAIEWLDGEDLEQRLERRGLTFRESLRLATRVATALGTAHARGIVHRDIKPSNLFLCNGEIEGVKVLDFGIARVNRGDPGATRTGVTIGTPGYMSPEQARGDRDIDARADVFSLGCVLFECLSGHPPFEGDHILAVLARILLEDAPRLADVCNDIPDDVDALVARMLAKSPRERPSDGAAVAIAIGAIEPVPLDRPRRSERPAELTSGEQRLMSVVLVGTQPGAGLRDSIAATMKSDDIVSPITRLRHVVENCRGRLEPLADGSVIALIAVPGAATDSAARAARCAIGMREVAPDAPMALATGRGVFTARSPVGEAIERAARMLLHSAPTGADDASSNIRVDEVTAGLLDARFDVGGDEHGLVLRSEREQTEVVRGLLGRPTACVGRERELNLLDTALTECVDEPVARAILITAAAGLGKSRLRFEFLQRVRQRPERVEIWLGRGDPMSIGSPFGLLAPAIRRAAAMSDGEPLAVRRQKLRARVARNVPLADTARVSEFIGEMVGVQLPDEDSVQLRAARQDATLMGDQMRRAWEDFVTAECNAQPLLIVIEDMQWGDLPSVNFIDSILRHCADQPLLVLAVGRPEVSTAFPNLWAGRALNELPLRAMSKRAGEALVRDVLGDTTTPEISARIVERAAGNAFYLEELIRAVAEGKGSDLPETVLAMVQSRLEELEPEARRVLRAASVYGQAFWSGGVLALLGGTTRTATTLDALPRLVAREFIERRPSSRFPGEDEYTFRHGLVREAAYAMLTDDDRALGHQLAGRWLEAAGETDPIALAEHYDRGGDPLHAVPWYRRAAEQALEGHDFGNTLALAERGVAAGAQGTMLGAMRLLEAEAERWRGDFAAAECHATEAAALLERGSGAWFRAVEEALIALGRQGRFADGVARADDAAQVVSSDGNAVPQILCLCTAARLRFQAGDYVRADQDIARVEQMAQGLDKLAPRAAAEVHRLRGASARHVGDLVGDLQGYSAAFEAFERAGDARNACNAQVSLGFAYVELGDFDRGGEELERALLSAERMALQPVCTRARQNLGLVWAFRNEIDKARELEQRSIEDSIAQGNVRFEGWTRIYLAIIEFRAGRFEAAEREARTAVKLLEVTPPARAGSLAALSRALLAAGRTEEARVHASEAMAILEKFGGIEEFESLVRVAHIEVLDAIGEHDAARAALETAVARIRIQADAIREPRWRNTFTHFAGENARILELARTRQIPGAE